MSENDEIDKLTKSRNLTLIGALLVGVSTALKYAGIFSVGRIPPWGSVLLVLALLVGAGVQTIKISKLQ